MGLCVVVVVAAIFGGDDAGAVGVVVVVAFSAYVLAAADGTFAAAQLGKHVICEKPLEVTVERVDAMIKEADKAGVIKAVLVENAEPVEYGQALFVIE